jgi:radical SAM superfamily enzyme
MNPFIYSLDNKRYHTLNYHYKKVFNSKVFKVSLNASFTCHNIDGTVGTGGCIYCSKNGSGEELSERKMI